MIGIRVGNVFSCGSLDMEDFKTRLRKVIKETEEWMAPDISDDLSCVSNELVAHKGSYVVIAGVFNYWDFEQVKFFAQKLSVEFGNAMCMSVDDDRSMQCEAFLDGLTLKEYEYRELY